MVGQDAAEQVHSLVLWKRGLLADHRCRQPEAPGELVGHAPLQEGSGGLAVVLVVLDVPGIDVGLAAGGQGDVVLGEPLEEGRGVLDLVAGMAATGRGDRLLFGAGAKPRQNFPAGEAADELDVFRVGNLSEVADQPPLERADLLVDDGKHAAGHQELPQVSGCPPGLEGVECLVGQFYLPDAEAP